MPSQRILRAPDVVHRVLDNEVVLLDLASGRYFGLNPTGAAFWEALGPDGTTLEQAEKVLLARFEVDSDVLHRDLEALVATLTREGLVRIES